MWEVIKYIFKCVCMVIAASGGNISKDLNWKTMFVGFATILTIIFIVKIIYYLIMKFSKNNSTDSDTKQSG